MNASKVIPKGSERTFGSRSFEDDFSSCFCFFISIVLFMPVTVLLHASVRTVLKKSF